MLHSEKKIFQTPDHSLFCEISDNTMVIRINLLKSKIVLYFYGILFILLFIIGWLLLFLDIYDKATFGFNITYSKILLGIFFVIMSILIDIIFIKLTFSSNRINKSLNQVHFLQDINAVFLLLIPFIAMASISSSIRLYFIHAFVFFLSSFLSLFIFYIYRKEVMEIQVERKSDSYNIVSVQKIPLIPFIHQRMYFKQIFFERIVNELSLALLPFSRSSRITKLQFKNKVLFHYTWLSFNEAKIFSIQINKFICYFVDKKIDFISKFGTMIGVKYPIEYIQQLIEFITPFAPISVIKLENKSEADFVNYWLIHAEEKSNRLNTFLWTFSILLSIILIIASFLVMLFIIYAIVIINDINFRIFFIISLIVPLITLSAPFRIWKRLKKANELEQSCIRKYSLNELEF